MKSGLGSVCVFLLFAATAIADVKGLPEYRTPVTASQRAQVLTELRGRISREPTWAAAATPLEAVERAIRRAQHGESYFRWPLDEDALKELQAELEPIIGRRLPLGELAPIVDRAQMLLRESRRRVALGEKVWRDGQVDRPHAQGEIAELRTARNSKQVSGRELVLTKDPQSQVFDLTEPTRNPRSFQVKVYEDPLKGLRELQADVANLPKRARYGLLPERDIGGLLANGHLRFRQVGDGPIVYRPTRGAELTVLPALGIEDRADSAMYAQSGRLGLQELWRDSAVEPLQVPRLAFAREVIGGALEVGAGALALYQSEREWREFGQYLRDPQRDELRLSLLGTRAGTMTLTGTSMLTSTASRLIGWQSAERLAGRVAIPLYVASELCTEGVALYDYRTGRISRDQLIVRSAGPFAGLASVGTGVTIGAAIGAWFSGVGAGPGALIGAGYGLLVGLPASIVADYRASNCCATMSQQQQVEFDRFVEQHYRQ